MFVKSQKVPKDEMHLDDYLQERYGPEGSIGLLMVVAIPFLVPIFLGFERYIASGVRPGDQVGLLIGFLLPMAVMALVPSFAICLLIDHLWERKIKRVKEQKFRERYPYWQPMK